MQVKIIPSDDSYIVQQDPGKVMGSQDYMQIDEYWNYDALMKFNMRSQIPAGTEIISANIFFYCFSTLDRDREAMVNKCGNNWNQGTVSWSNRPSVGARIGGMGWGVNKWHSLDVTPYMLERHNADGIISFYFTTAVHDRNWSGERFYSKEKGGGYEPYLLIETAEALPLPPTPTPTPTPTPPTPVPPPPNGDGVVRASIDLIAFPWHPSNDEATMRSQYETLISLGLNAFMGGYGNWAIENWNKGKGVEVAIDRVYNIAAEYGIRVYWYTSAHRLPWTNPDTDPPNQTFVGRYKNFPACAGWLYGDEPALNHWPHQQAKDAYNKVKSMDPNHPAFPIWSADLETDHYMLTMHPAWGDLYDLSCTDIYPQARAGANWATELANRSNLTYRYTGKSPYWGFEHWQPRDHIAVIQAWVEGGMPDIVGQYNVLKNGLGGWAGWGDRLIGIGFWHPSHFLFTAGANAENIRNQIKDLARLLGWQERVVEEPEVIITPPVEEPVIPPVVEIPTPEPPTLVQVEPNNSLIAGEIKGTASPLLVPGSPIIYGLLVKVTGSKDIAGQLNLSKNIIGQTLAVYSKEDLRPFQGVQYFEANLSLRGDEKQSRWWISNIQEVKLTIIKNGLPAPEPPVEPVEEPVIPPIEEPGVIITPPVEEPLILAEPEALKERILLLDWLKNNWPWVGVGLVGLSLIITIAKD
ncbi:MAG TPA: DNRLRE domain-containing protein [bacterium]|nr:DNRLRE domain-containing protein [bacterium]